MNEALDQIGPDEEIELLGLKYEAIKMVRPWTKMTFSQWVEIQTPRLSNAWAYECNRGKTTLISF